ncbi:haloacid dehalogenase-like hydrolase [Rhizobiales bacterium]|nr:haloacid dehalogenase-like hydrolase [Hongsoonwoonella zoysiae]
MVAGFSLFASVVQADPLPSWSDTESKARIMEFVDRVTEKGADTYVAPDDRIAVFDNDGTLWSEQPLYFQLIFAIDRLQQRAQADPSILTSDVLKKAASGDVSGALAGGKQALLEIVEVSHSGLTVDEFQNEAREWLETARHPQTGMAYDEMVYQPMLELLSYLRDRGFQTYIVSGGGIHFMRVFAEDVYGIPPEKVIGSAGNTSYSVENGVPTIQKDPGIAFIDDGPGKPIRIETKIGKRPIFVGGNSDGDFQMLEWATAGDGPRFGLIVHHTDGQREFAYDRESHVGKLARGLDEADGRGWLVVDMARDWKAVFPNSE